MPIVLVSLIASFAQMMLLMLSAHLMGVTQYGVFSLGAAIALFLSALSSEWLRMVLARQAGNYRTRLRFQLIIEIRKLMFVIAAGIVMTGGLVIAAASTVGFLELNREILAISILAASNLILDMTATLLRFTAKQKIFSAFSLGRVLITGSATVTVAALFTSGVASIYAFAAANLVVCVVVTRLVWPLPRKRVKIRLLWRFARVGVAMSTSSVSVAWAVTSLRSVLAICLPPSVAGGLFVALDLGQRGLTVLGGALSTWGVRLVYDSAHSKNIEETTQVFRKVFDVSIFLWLSLAMYGTFTAIIAPAFFARIEFTSTYITDASLVLLALLTLLGRVYLLDPLMAALSKEREIAIAAATLALATAIGCLLALLSRNAWIAILVAPAVVIISLAIFWARNALIIRQYVSRNSGRYILVKIALCPLLVVFFIQDDTKWIALILLIILFLFDCRQFIYIFKARFVLLLNRIYQQLP